MLVWCGLHQDQNIHFVFIDYLDCLVIYHATELQISFIVFMMYILKLMLHKHWPFRLSNGMKMWVKVNFSGNLIHAVMPNRFGVLWIRVSLARAVFTASVWAADLFFFRVMFSPLVESFWFLAGYGSAHFENMQSHNFSALAYASSSYLLVPIYN